MNKILRKPRVTEKAALAAEKGVYVFNVEKDTNKISIAGAVKKEYKVTPVKVRTVTSGGNKKAYVWLKKGEKIDII